MEQINDILSQLYKILNCRMALLKDNMIYYYPVEAPVIFEGQELQNYNSWSIDAPGSRVVFYTENGVDVVDSSLKLAALYIKEQLWGKNSLDNSINKLLSGSYNYTDIAAVDQLIIKEKTLNLIIVSGLDVKSIENELLEIIKNSVDVKYIAEYQGNLIGLIEEQNIYEACSNLQKNILTELFVETVISIGGCLEKPQQLASLYNNGIEAIMLKQSYGINQRLLDYQSMLIYRLITSIDQELKSSIVDRIFSNRFIELLNNELELTIEEMFKNNLNLTDTSSRLYIHRNTLLYRIDKIYKLTGFDLRKFEDSMIFKLAWLMYKEKLK
jgi:hypothetical protein